MQTTPLTDVHRLVWTALCAALIAAGAMLVIPAGSIPFSMQPFFVFLAGFILGPVLGGASVLLYIGAGAAGLPVFQRGMAGVEHLFGPTGGFLAGFVVCAALAGLARSKDHPLAVPWLRGLAFGLAGQVGMYLLGYLWLKYRLDLGWWQAFVAGVAPFFGQGVLKLVMAVACVRLLAKSRLLPQ
jgi:biotin transport system substrate-specific component